MDKNQVNLYNFQTRSKIVDFSCPRHLAAGFELLCHALTLYPLLNQPREYSLCLFVNISKASVQFSACEFPYIQTYRVPVICNFLYIIAYRNALFRKI